MKLNTTKFNDMIANAAARVKISSTIFKAFISDVKSVVDANDDVVTTHLAETVHQSVTAARDISITGVQTISGLSGTPKAIQIHAVVNETKLFSIGKWTQEGGHIPVLAQRHVDGVMSYFNNQIIFAYSSPGNYATAAVQNVANGSFELNWNLNGTISGTMQLFISVDYH